VSVRPQQLQVLGSTEDRSVNFVEDQLVGFLESRYVRKVPEYFIAYLSSQTGCNRGCTFCHLTTTGQTRFEDSTADDFLGQALKVMKHYDRQDEPANHVHWNFMARGEPLANQHLLGGADAVLAELGALAKRRGLGSRFNVSTIMPLTFREHSLAEVFGYVHPTVYYSLYSTDEGWRKKWMPGAMPVNEALSALRDYQRYSKKVVKIHHPLIRGENDSLVDAKSVREALSDWGLLCEFNLVRYNPASPAQGREADQAHIDAYLDLLRGYPETFTKVQVIPRVGQDVKASCGMFVE
jgi:23S rRNA (adenine2503-C2)-methyltransferase